MEPDILLSRETFREAVFARDGNRCVRCKAPGVGASGQVVARPVKLDAHHIIERRLWPDGGYYLDNGVSLCEPCHIEAESTRLSCEELRALASINHAHLPPHLYRDQRYDKWGNPILDNGERVTGELMDDPSVQKIMDPKVVFTPYIKYPRTFHLPWSPGVTKDDRIMEDVDDLLGENVVVTEKMDGENTTMYRDYIHARSIDSGNHPSRDRVKALWANIAADIPQGWRICGENLYAKHSIAYTDLPSYFLVFSIWDGLKCLPWRDTVEWAQLFGLPTVNVLWEGPGRDLPLPSELHKEGREGYVVRVAREFHFNEFRKCVGKFVRKGHVQTHGHWMRQKLEPNKLIGD